MFTWVGGADHVRQFKDIFRRERVATGDAYFVASPAERQMEYERLAATRRCSSVSFAGADMSDPNFVTKVLSPGAALRMKEWEAHRPAGLRTYLVDLDHHPATKGPQGGDVTQKTTTLWEHAGLLDSTLVGFA